MSEPAMRRLVIATLALALGAFGCDDAETVNPLQDGGAGASAPDGGGGGGGSSPVKRTVMQRNPFGDVAETENLLWDGDFEWFSVFSDEYGWINGPMLDSFTFTGVIVGPDCRSGMKCATIPPEQTIVGIGVASKGDPLEASFYAKTKTGSCAEVSGIVASIFTTPTTDPEVTVKALTKNADASGWCHYDSIIAARTEKPSLIIANKTSGPLGDTVIVDDCVLKVVPKGTPPEPIPVDDGMHRIADLARAGMAKRRGPHDPPPNAARRAFEAWKSHR